jgi:hypothetical protein
MRARPIIMLIGYIAILAGYISADRFCNGNDCSADIAAGAAAIIPCACVATDDTTAETPGTACDTNPVKLAGSALNGINVDAADVAPA